jgi:hypothetical protein
VITALRDDHGRLTGFAKITRDLTERRNAEEAIGELAGRLFLLQTKNASGSRASCTTARAPI